MPAKKGPKHVIYMVDTPKVQNISIHMVSTPKLFKYAIYILPSQKGTKYAIDTRVVPSVARVLVYGDIGADLEDQFLLGSTSATNLEDQFLLGYASDLPPARSKDRLYFHKIHTLTILDPEALC